MRIVDLPAYAYPWNFLYGLHPLARVYVQERQRDLHLVHFHSVFIPENVQLAIIQRRPYVLTPNGGYSLQVLQDRQRWCKSVWLQLRETAYIQQAALIHAVSPPERAALRHLFPGQLVIYIPNAVTPPCLPDNREMILRARPKVLLFLGRLALGQKGLGRLLHGYAAFLAHTGDRQTHLTLAGPDFRNGRQSLEKLAADLRIVDRVSFKGPVNGEAKWTLLRSSYALVHPSRWEGMPFSVLEALAVGCPALITAETNLAEMVQAHATGIVVSGLPQDIAQGLQELISMPPERYDAMQHQARKVIEDHCTWDQVTASMAQLYQDVVGGARHT